MASLRPRSPSYSSSTSLSSSPTTPTRSLEPGGDSSHHHSPARKTWAAPRRAETPPPPTASATATPTALDSPTAFLSRQLESFSLAESPVKPLRSTPRVRGPPQDPRAQRPPSPLTSSINLGASSPSSAPTSTVSSAATGNSLALAMDESSEAVRPASPVDQLAMLALSSRITEWSFQVHEVSTMIFEIQELRHATSSASKPTGPGAETSASSNVTEMDQALMRLDSKLELVRQEFVEIESHLKPLVEREKGSNDDVETRRSTEVDFLNEKWDTTCREWDSVQRDADMLGDEMKEDKWLVVFNSVIQQAEGMMRSLEKVLEQSHEFAWDVNRRKASLVSATGPREGGGGGGVGARGTGSSSIASLPSLASSPSSSSSSALFSTLSTSTSSSSTPHPPDPSDLQSLLSTFVSLHRSLHAKKRYYAPATTRVLRILGNGIAERTTQNGSVRRRYGEVRARWDDVQKRIARVEGEMIGVEETLREWGASEPAGFEDSVTSPAASSPSPFKKDRANDDVGSNLLTPPKGSDPPGRVSPLRRLANKMTTPRKGRAGSTASTTASDSPASDGRGGGARGESEPPAAVAIDHAARGEARFSPSAASAGVVTPTKPTPPRPPKSLKRFANSTNLSNPSPPPSSSPSSPPETPQPRSRMVGSSLRPIVDPRASLSHRRSSSALSASVGASSNVFGGAGGPPGANPVPRRAISPMPMSTMATPLKNRPRWNPSTKRTTEEEREVLSQSALGKGRPSSRSQTPVNGFARSGRQSSVGYPGGGGIGASARPSSRMSMTSSMSRSYSGLRPVSPSFSDVSSIGGGGGLHRERPETPSRIPRPNSVIGRPRSTTPSAYGGGPSYDQTSLMQRAFSPTLSTSSKPGGSRSSRPPPAPSRYSMSRSVGAPAMPRSVSASHIPNATTPSTTSRKPSSSSSVFSTVGGSLSPPRAVSPSPSATSAASSYCRTTTAKHSMYRRSLQATPEPSLMAHVERLASIRDSRPPPVPRVPSTYRNSMALSPGPPARSASSSNARSSSMSASSSAARSVSPLPPSSDFPPTAYIPNPIDPLDCAVSDVANALPLALDVERVDPPLSRKQADEVDLFSARYTLSLPGSASIAGPKGVLLKLVDRVGPRAVKGDKKVLVRVGTGWQDLENYCWSLIALAV
ncbi:hypothetical protein JCM10212_001325 [Sporobolomyces blumeae]